MLAEINIGDAKCPGKSFLALGIFLALNTYRETRQCSENYHKHRHLSNTMHVPEFPYWASTFKKGLGGSYEF
jgi:hypothetical protein